MGSSIQQFHRPKETNEKGRGVFLALNALAKSL